MSTNQLSVEITQEMDTTVQQLLESILAEMGFLVDLDVKGRIRLVKMGRKNLDFVTRGLRHVEGSPQYLPRVISFEEFKKDVDLGQWLRKVEKKLDSIVDLVKDTAMLAESEAYQTARLYYNSVKASAKAGDEAAEPIARDLGLHFKRQVAEKVAAPQPEESQK